MTAEPTILCPNCHTAIPLSAAVTHGIREELGREFAARQRTLEEAVAGRERQLAAERDLLEKAKLELDAQVRQRMEAEQQKLLASAKEQAREQLGREMQDLQGQLLEKATALKEARENELALRKQQRELQERSEALELEVARKLEDERAKIREAAQVQAAEEQQFRLAEKERLIAEMQKQIFNLQQKANQGSQQVQGEVMEAGLKQALLAAFPDDAIDDVPVGVRGADVVQTVRSPLGAGCGTIVWESKRTKNWSPGWIAKLKDDQRTLGAEIAVIVSEALPDGISQFGQEDGVWVVGFGAAAILATGLRHGLIETAAARQAGHRRDEKMHVLYDYLAAPGFRQKIETITEAFTGMKADLDRERTAMQRIWKKRETQLLRVLTGTATLYGELQGIIGSAALPEIPVLELAEAEHAAEEMPALSYEPGDAE